MARPWGSVTCEYRGGLIVITQESQEFEMVNKLSGRDMSSGVQADCLKHRQLKKSGPFQTLFS